jgi:phage host-nuclease inhibitor protein Gam
MEFGPWMGLITFASGIVWGLITMYFKVNELQKEVKRDKEDSQRDLKAIGNKVRRLETAMANDRSVDIATTREPEIRMWKAGIMKEETKS